MRNEKNGTWLTANRMTMKTGLIEMFCGFDTGHDSGRFKNIHKGNFSEDAKDYPHDDESLPYITPDMNAVFYGSKTALAVMAGKLNLDEEAHTWKQAAHEVKKKIMEICYDEEDDFFYDIDRNGNKVKCKSISITNLFCESLIWIQQKEYSINILIIHRNLKLTIRTLQYQFLILYGNRIFLVIHGVFIRRDL